MPEAKDDANGSAPPIYESHPPAWLPNVHSSADLGYLGFYPPRAGQDEDLLSEANVKNGFVLGKPVAAETFSAHSLVNADLSSTATFSKLEALMNEIFIRRADSIPSIPPSTFRIPTRVTLNDSKRQAWFADLANPEVPLHKLGKSVPHGAKGHDLLDLLQSNNVAIPRAVWFLRVFGANETAGLRNKPTYNPTQYSVDWANVVTSYVKKQLADIALPSAPRPGLNIKQTFKGVLSDGDTRERWISRFTYCLQLLRTFYSEGLVDNRTFFVWVVQQLGTCNLAQAGFIARLADEYLDGMVGSRPLTRPFIDACLSKLCEIRSTSAQEFLRDTEALFATLLQRLCIVLPDSFISPRMWRAHSLLLADVLGRDVLEHPANVQLERNSRDVGLVLQHNFADIKRRNEAMLFQRLPVRVFARLGSAVSDIKLLNSINSATDLGSLPYFLHSTTDEAVLSEKLDMLLTWSVTPLQYGDHRPFAAVTLIHNWRAQAGDRATRRDFRPPDEFLQDRLFHWLDSSDVAGHPDNIRAVSLLFGKLVKQELFSYASYIQRLIARGEAGLSSTAESRSRHGEFLRWIPLSKSTSSLISQRKATLYGARTREMPEDANERDIRREIRAVLPHVFGGEASVPVTPISTSALLSSCYLLVNSTRFEQVRTFRQWLLPILRKHISSQEPRTNATLLKTYATSVELMAYTKCFHCILDLTLCLLEHSTTGDLLIAVIDTLHRFSTIWACMNAMGSIVSALDRAHQVWKARGIQSRPLLSLLLEFDGGKHLNDLSRTRITADIALFTSALQPATEHPDLVPNVLPEILLLAGDPDADAPSILANSLWIKYRRSVDWAWKVWDNTVASLRQVPVMTSDEAERRVCALRYGVFLWQVDQHLATGLDREVLQWCLGPGKNEISALSSDAWSVLTLVLLYLSVRGALRTTTILQGLVYPAWQQAATINGGPQGLPMEIFLRSANDICRRLLLSEEIDDSLPPADLFDLQCIRTRRQDVYCAPHFPLLASSIPLLICVEHNEHIPQELRADVTSLRHLISQDRDFRQGAYRNLDVIRDAFELSLLHLDEPCGPLSKHIVAGLRTLLCDISDDLDLSDWPTVTCLLSPWKIPATMVQMQLILKQMGQELLHDPTNQAAHANLDRLIRMLFRHSMTSEEAFYVGEMARGVDRIVAGKFINNGLQCIAEMIRESGSIAETQPEQFQKVGELLRVLIYVAEPLRQETAPLPEIEGSIQEAFVEALSSKLVSMEHTATSNSIPRRDVEVVQELALVLRLLQFELGFRSVWSPRTKEATEQMASTLFRLTMVYGASVSPCPMIYPLMIDTLYYIYDEIANDPKSSPYDPFRNYPDMSTTDLPSELPVECLKQLASLLPILPATASVSHMVNSYRDAAGHMVYGTPVVNRPWEWIENLGEPAALDFKEEDKDREAKERLENKYPVKNSGSLSLETFGARLTGEGILRKAAQETVPRKEGNPLGFGDGLSSENLFRRDWRETRVDLDADVTRGVSAGRPGDELDHDMSGAFHLAPKQEKRTTPRASPASSVVSRSSARGSASSVRQSPQGSSSRHSNTTVSEIIDVDSIACVTPRRPPVTKRKASSAAAVSDDEIEIIEGPVAMRTMANKKSKVKPPAKAKTKKK
ncbi:putative transcription mediator complex subunit Med12 [Lyophyllum shimeji]|uniref:Mediator of RNA polymerase II transcription subunit 12 n=1 Tax=Lyophyllum shimeji TaxID=47721 RepID=A0A9P3ULE8_LYOSH|nr:putative transcription mediator complex subunit Med12 [Lyophyllum shimeji]